MLNKETNADFVLLTHKTNQNETFIKHLDILNDNQFLVKLHIYHQHKNYDDVTTTPELINPMFLLECCRQAETYIAHRVFNLPLSFKFILKSWWLSTIQDGYENIKKANCNEISIYIKSDCSLIKGDKLRNNWYLFSIRAGDCVISEAYFNVGYMRGENYLKVRGGILPVNQGKQQVHFKSAAQSLGYNSESNSMLSEVRLVNKIYITTLSIPKENATYNDHYQDHITGINLVEAAKQLCFYYLSEVMSCDISTCSIKKINSVFEQYVENNIPTFLSLDRVERDAAGEYEFMVSVMQEEKCKALCVLKLRGT
jgi:hypothetical protein